MNYSTRWKTGGLAFNSNWLFMSRKSNVADKIFAMHVNHLQKCRHFSALNDEDFLSLILLIVKL